MHHTPTQIINYLETYQTATAGDLSVALDLTAANIRYHLAALEKAGKVRAVTTRTSGGAGRPPTLYGLTPMTRGTAFQEFSSIICHTLQHHPAKSQLIHQIVSRLIADMQPAQSQITRFNDGVEFLNQLQYQAAWEARPEGPQVMLHHCPYLDLPHQTPFLCEMDERLLSELMQYPLKLIQKRSPDQLPGSRCVFQA